MDRLNTGFIALGTVGILFLGLQIWWISMTIGNTRNKSNSSDQSRIDQIKDRLERSFRL